jgi:hypothetical protein
MDGERRCLQCRRRSIRSARSTSTSTNTVSRPRSRWTRPQGPQRRHHPFHLGQEERAGLDAGMASGAFRRWLTLEEPTWARVDYPKIDFQDIYYYAAPKNQTGPEVARRGRSGTAQGLREARHSAEGAGDSRRRAEAAPPTADDEDVANDNVYKSGRVAVDAVFDSVSVVTTFKEELKPRPASSSARSRKRSASIRSW